jgi:hypothetical protein
MLAVRVAFPSPLLIGAVLITSGDRLFAATVSGLGQTSDDEAALLAADRPAGCAVGIRAYGLASRRCGPAASGSFR